MITDDHRIRLLSRGLIDLIKSYDAVKSHYTPTRNCGCGNCWRRDPDQNCPREYDPEAIQLYVGVTPEKKYF